MSSSVPPRPAPAPEPADATADPTGAPTDGDGADADVAEPLNRAARRAKARQDGPSHVGPRGELERRIRGAGGGRKRKR